MSNPRQIAAQALLKIETEKAYSNLTLNNLLSISQLSDLDKALCTSIFYGVLDRKITIDYVIKKFITTPIKKLKPYTLTILRSAIYQIMYMDKIPNSAVVNESVSLIKQSGESFNSGFVNGVLRNFLRQGITLPNGNDINSISVLYSCPAQIVSMLIRDLGIENTKEFLKNSLVAPPTFIRINTNRTNTNELSLLLKKYGVSSNITNVPNALSVKNLKNVEQIEEFKQGLFHVEDLSCQHALQSLDIKKNSRVLDVCAAPGGKTFTAAQIAYLGKVVSCDLHEHRVKLIENGAKRLRLDNVEAYVQDATEFNKQLGLFDRIICDVPCSGIGVIRRKPDIKYKNISDLDELLSIQKKILVNSLQYLKDDGKLLYSTCTLNSNENRDVVDFALNGTDFKVVYEHTFLPHIDGGDGFYAAVITK